jgi:drug/metabolite transporter (DMT)-like permease
MLVISTIFNILALRGLEYKNAPVIESLGYILVMILSRIFFNESIGKKKVIGNLFILIGVLIFYM